MYIEQMVCEAYVQMMVQKQIRDSWIILFMGQF